MFRTAIAHLVYVIVSSSPSLHNRSRLRLDDVVLSNACVPRYDELLLLINKKKEKEDLLRAKRARGLPFLSFY